MRRRSLTGERSGTREGNEKHESWKQKEELFFFFFWWPDEQERKGGWGYEHNTRQICMKM